METPSESEGAPSIELRPIGRIRSRFTAKSDAPIQGAFHPEEVGTVEVFPEFADGLDDIEGFSHLILIYGLDRAAVAEMRRMPFLGDEPHGVFATRHPARPNALGLTVVRLLSRSGTRLEVGGVDILNDTPLLDIKPYIPRFDAFPDATEGWFTGLPDRPKPAGRE